MIKYQIKLRTFDGKTSWETDGGECTLQEGKQSETQHAVRGREGGAASLLYSGRGAGGWGGPNIYYFSLAVIGIML